MLVVMVLITASLTMRVWELADLEKAYIEIPKEELAKVVTIDSRYSGFSMRGSFYTAVYNLPDVDIGGRLHAVDPFYLPNLKRMILCGSEFALTRIENVDHIPTLEELNLCHNRLTKMENLAGISSLKELSLHGNWFEEIENLYDLPNLKLLYLSTNRIRRISGLDDLPNLEGLALYSNPITKIENLDKLSKLSVLDLGHTKIKEIGSSLDGLDSLACVDLSFTEIESVSFGAFGSLPRETVVLYFASDFLTIRQNQCGTGYSVEITQKTSPHFHNDFIHRCREKEVDTTLYINLEGTPFAELSGKERLGLLIKNSFTLLEFLKEFELEKYYDVLIDKGYRQVSDLKCIKESDLVDVIPKRFELRRLLIEIDKKNELEPCC